MAAKKSSKKPVYGYCWRKDSLTEFEKRNIENTQEN